MLREGAAVRGVGNEGVGWGGRRKRGTGPRGGPGEGAPLVSTSLEPEAAANVAPRRLNAGHRQPPSPQLLVDALCSLARGGAAEGAPMRGLQAMNRLSLSFPGYGLTCYECNSKNDSRCALDIPPDSLKKDCSEHIEGSKYTMCRKITQSIDFEVNGCKYRAGTTAAAGRHHGGVLEG